jgi:cytochrome c553/predicted small lipoprotein YifL
MISTGSSIRLFLAAIAAIGLASCKHEIPLPLPPDDGGNPPDTVIVNPHPCDPDTVYFQNTILPLLASSCAKTDCHDQASHEEGIRMYSYASIMNSNIISPGHPLNSELYEVITENDPDDIMPPPPDAPMSPEQISLIYDWIAQGAKNNSCIADCDPAAHSFSQNIQPVIELACEGCHSGSNPSGGLSLTNYAQISASALSGSLMAGLLGTNGVPIMPEGTSGLPQCNIDQIQAWVDAGAPND